MLTRAAAHFVQHLLGGAQRPKDMTMKEFMYECFRRDVARGQRSENMVIPEHTGILTSVSRLRLLSFNVHFFRSGYSGVELGDSSDEIFAVVKLLNPDLVLLQEVPASRIAETEQRLQALGYAYHVAAGSGDAHVLPPTGSFAHERLHVCIASRLPLGRKGPVLMDVDGHAAFVEVELPRPVHGEQHRSAQFGGDAQPRLRVYCLHLSVRCDASKRQREVAAVLRHAADASTPAAMTLIAGDFNQPNEPDYPAEEWRAIAADLRAAKLPLSDGTMEALRTGGFVPSWEAATLPRPLVASTAWNGAVVDYCYCSKPGAEPPPVEVEATYAYATLASDHLPLVVDLRVA